MESTEWMVRDIIRNKFMSNVDVNSKESIQGLIDRVKDILGDDPDIMMQLVQAMRYEGDLGTVMWDISTTLENIAMMELDGDDNASDTMNRWTKYIANTTYDDVSIWDIDQIGEWAWAELVAQRDAYGSIHTTDYGDPMTITQPMIDWATGYAQDSGLGDDWSII